MCQIRSYRLNEQVTSTKDLHRNRLIPRQMCCSLACSLGLVLQSITAAVMNIGQSKTIKDPPKDPHHAGHSRNTYSTTYVHVGWMELQSVWPAPVNYYRSSLAWLTGWLPGSSSQGTKIFSSHLAPCSFYSYAWQDEKRRARPVNACCRI